MNRYFIFISYNGKKYSGSQKQINANTIENELEKVLNIYFKPLNKILNLTSSSRTDAGVHAKKNIFHFDLINDLTNIEIKNSIYHLNSILPNDIAILDLKKVKENSHSRFDALSRTYNYHIYFNKNPFKNELALFYGYKLDYSLLKWAANEILKQEDFTSFCKKHNQSNTKKCNIYYCNWNIKENEIIFEIKANRFLRGMVRALIATMLNLSRNKINTSDFKNLFINSKIASANFNAPPYGLYLIDIEFDNEIFV